MAKEAWEIEANLREVGASEDLISEAGEWASKLEAAGYPRIVKPTPRIELPKGIRTETLKSDPLSKQDFAERFKQKGSHVTSSAQALIDRFELTGKPQDLTLAWLSGRDLGLSRAVPFSRFLEAGQEKGYKLLHPEVGLYLRDYDIEQPLGDFYWVAMEPITVHSARFDDPSVFFLARFGSGLWLYASWSDPGGIWRPGSRLAFSLGK